MRVSMRCVVNNAELQRNETPLDRSTFTSFRSTSPSSRISIPPSLLPSLQWNCSRCTCIPLSLYQCIPRLPPSPRCSALSHTFLLIADGIKKYLKCPEYTSIETGRNEIVSIPLCARSVPECSEGGPLRNALYLFVSVSSVLCWSTTVQESRSSTKLIQPIIIDDGREMQPAALRALASAFPLWERAC